MHFHDYEPCPKGCGGDYCDPEPAFWTLVRRFLGPALLAALLLYIADALYHCF